MSRKVFGARVDQSLIDQFRERCAGLKLTTEAGLTLALTEFIQRRPWHDSPGGDGGRPVVEEIGDGRDRGGAGGADVAVDDRIAPMNLSGLPDYEDTLGSVPYMGQSRVPAEPSLTDKLRALDPRLKTARDLLPDVPSGAVGPDPEEF